ncbi:hypothetical protein LTR37_014373 [Vermiconidia calcicola]|uniref:Uncharacterized protein n=1 Tax=Vermiconidia calcicola TaxID=1690605 RepID=A0ACC3MV81_9PEZI|nr:hypothetical protein LTR37_014373 [Vermiconidia calcicola]
MHRIWQSRGIPAAKSTSHLDKLEPIANGVVSHYAHSYTSTPLMPCRNPQAVGKALQHIWITDDVLAEAFHRFMRVSQTSRRYGSSVPGPLEARRRLAKRKMGMAAVASGSAPPDGDIGELFGVGAVRPPPDFERGWRWEAPTPHWATSAGRKKVKKKADEWQWAGISPDGTLWDQIQESVTHEEEQRADDFLCIPPDPVADSKASFDALLKPLEGKMVLDEGDVRRVLEFWNSPANVPEAELTQRFIEWLSSRNLADDKLWHSIVNHIKGRMTGLAMSYNEYLSILTCVRKRSEDWARVLHRVAAFPRSAHHLYPRLTEHTLTNLTDPDEQKAKISVWLSCVRQGRRKIDSGYEPTEPWAETYSLLSKHFQPSDFAEHFGSLPRQRFAIVLLRFWVPRYIEMSKSRSKAPDSTLTQHALDWATVDAGNERIIRPPEYRLPEDTALQSISELLAKHDLQAKAYALNELVLLLASNGLPHSRLQDEIFTVYTATQPNSTIKNLFMDLRRRKRDSLTTQIAVKLVRHFIESGDIANAYYVFTTAPTVPLLQFFDLPRRLIEEGRTHGEKVFRILNRRAPEDIVAEPFRIVSKLWLKQKHIDVVHIAAYAWATSPHLSARTAFRRVWECYRFLKDRGAPFTPLMSRAMVKAGITRAIKENGRLSKFQVKYIIQTVKFIEGEEIAKEVDRLVFEHWRRVRLAIPAYRPGTPDGQRWFDMKRRLWQRRGGTSYRPPIMAKEDGFEELDGAVAVAEPSNWNDVEAEVESTWQEMVEVLGDTRYDPATFEAGRHEPTVNANPSHSDATAHTGSATDYRPFLAEEQECGETGAATGMADNSNPDVGAYPPRGLDCTVDANPVLPSTETSWPKIYKPSLSEEEKLGESHARADVIDSLDLERQPVVTEDPKQTDDTLLASLATPTVIRCVRSTVSSKVTGAGRATRSHHRRRLLNIEKVQLGDSENHSQ